MARSPQSFKVVRQDGTTYDLDALNVIVNRFKVSSPTPIHTRETIDNRHGYLNFGTTYSGRTFETDLTVLPVDNIDFEFMRNDLFDVFDSLETFHIIRDLEPGKRIAVQCEDSFTFDRSGIDGETTLSLSSPSAFWESVGKTLDPMTFDSNLWQIGQGLIMDLSEADYTQSTTTFSIYNAGKVTIDPRELPLEITYTGASTNLEIENTTTGDSWQYTGTSVTNDIILLDGIMSKKNGTSIFQNTNRSLITLKPGWNEFVLTGTSGAFTISFDFRFYYK